MALPDKAVNQHKRMAMGEKNVGFNKGGSCMKAGGKAGYNRGGKLYEGEATTKGGYSEGGKAKGYAKGGSVKGGCGKGPISYTTAKMKKGGSVL